MRRWLIWMVVLAALAAGGWVISRPVPRAVDLATIARGTIRATIEEQARTRPKEIYLLSAPVQGRLMRVELEEGDRVQGGDEITEIDPLEIQSRVDELRAQMRAVQRRIEGVDTKIPKADELERAAVLEASARRTFDAAKQEEAELKAVHTFAATERERMSQLRASKSIAQAKLDAAVVAETQARQRLLAHQSRMRVLELQIKIASLEGSVLKARMRDYEWEKKVYSEQVSGLEASLRALTADLGRTRITAPIGGTVLALHKTSEQVVRAGEAILEIADLTQLEVEAEFLSEDAAHLREGMPAEIFGRALGERVIEGEVLRIEPRAFEKISSLGVEQQRVKVIVAIAAKDSGLMDQFRVQVRVILHVKENALLVPEGALFRERGRWFAFRLRDGKAERVEVQTGTRDLTQREVTAGLAEGDQVVLYPGDSLKAGDLITPLGAPDGAR